MKPFLSSLLIALLLLPMLAVTAAAADAAMIDLGPLYSTGAEFIAAVASGVLIALLGWIAAIIKRKVGIDIDAKHRETLHSALMTGVTAGLVKIENAAPGTIDVKSALIAAGIDWAGQAASDAIKHFGVTPAQLETLAASKVSQVLGTSAS